MPSSTDTAFERTMTSCDIRDLVKKDFDVRKSETETSSKKHDAYRGVHRALIVDIDVGIVIFASSRFLSYSPIEDAKDSTLFCPPDPTSTNTDRRRIP